MAPVLAVHVPISQFKNIHNKACDATLLAFFIHTIQLLGALCSYSLLLQIRNFQFKSCVF